MKKTILALITLIALTGCGNKLKGTYSDQNEIMKQEQERKKKFDKGYIRRKFKYLEKEQKKKEITNDNKVDILYEDYYVREAQKSLEKKFEQKFEKQGMDEIMNNLIENTGLQLVMILTILLLKVR